MGRIRDEFRQVSEEYVCVAERTELGLTISKKSAELTGADFIAESTPGSGSKFIIPLPINAGTEESADKI